MLRRLFIAVLLSLAALSCAPEIGDPCNSSIECPEGSACDTTATNGYCLVFECEANTCPDNSVCIQFRVQSACMRYCKSNSDCRTEDGQICRTDRGPVGFCYHPDTE